MPETTITLFEAVSLAISLLAVIGVLIKSWNERGSAVGEMADSIEHIIGPLNDRNEELEKDNKKLKRLVKSQRKTFHKRFRAILRALKSVYKRIYTIIKSIESELPVDVPLVVSEDEGKSISDGDSKL